MRCSREAESSLKIQTNGMKHVIRGMIKHMIWSGASIVRAYASSALVVGPFSQLAALMWVVALDIRPMIGTGTSHQPTLLPYTTMPADRISSSVRRSSDGEGSFHNGASTHNPHRFTSARDDLSRPYPDPHEVYRRSNTAQPR